MFTHPKEIDIDILHRLEQGDLSCVGVDEEVLSGLVVPGDGVGHCVVGGLAGREVRIRMN